MHEVRRGAQYRGDRAEVAKNERTRHSIVLAPGDQVIRGKPSAACQRCRGTETSAEDLVGPPERMVSERPLHLEVR